MCEHCEAQDLDYLGGLDSPAITRLFWLISELLPNGLFFTQRIALAGYLWEVIMEHERAGEVQQKGAP